MNQKNFQKLKYQKKIKFKIILFYNQSKEKNYLELLKAAGYKIYPIKDCTNNKEIEEKVRKACFATNEEASEE